MFVKGEWICFDQDAYETEVFEIFDRTHQDGVRRFFDWGFVIYSCASTLARSSEGSSESCAFVITPICGLSEQVHYGSMCTAKSRRKV